MFRNGLGARVRTNCEGYLKGEPAMPKRKAGAVPPRLTEAEQEFVWHMEQGYQLETDSLSGDPVLRRLKDDEVVRPASANRNTVKALEERGLISPGKSRDPLRIVWHLRSKAKK